MKRVREDQKEQALLELMPSFRRSHVTGRTSDGMLWRHSLILDEGPLPDLRDMATRGILLGRMGMVDVVWAGDQEAGETLYPLVIPRPYTVEYTGATIEDAILAAAVGYFLGPMGEHLGLLEDVP